MELPISASLGAMGPLLRKLDMLLLEPSEGLLRLHKGAKRWTYLLKDDLEEITSYLQDLSEVEDPPLTAKCWMKEVRELSYYIENYIDRFVLPGHAANKTRSGRRRCHRIRVRQIKISRLLETSKKLNRRKRVAARISDFRIDAREALERHKRYDLHCCAGIRRVLLPAAGRLPATWEEGAGIIIDDRMRKFMDSMADDRDPELKVVSVVGSEGIGKTTLVKVLYHKLKGRFDCRAFIRLTRKPDIKTVLCDILTQVQKQQPHNHCDDPDLLGKIREHLQYKRYLVVIDDLWSASIWDVISYAFPGGKMCSRIITSTQTEDVALACSYYHSEYVFSMRPLDDNLSRELFFNSLFFPESDFPRKLKDVLNKIVQVCGGFPLAITVIASLLATHPVILMEQWAYISDSLRSKLRASSSASEGMKLVVNFSYNDLTCHLKTCLLYLSMYPEGYTVCKDDLVKQWVAEGFIDGTEGKQVETAESYFHELIGRRFLQPECIKYNGEIASCSVHEVVRDLIAQKSLEENFVLVLDRYRRNVSLSGKVHRLSLHFPHTKLAMTNIRLLQVRSLTCFGLSKYMPSIREFKLLLVLNLNLSGHDNDDEDIIDLTCISELLQLRYLKVASDVCVKLPKHMGGLQYLEAVDISKKVMHVPSDIIQLPRLLHLHLPFETNLMRCLGPAASVWSFGKPTGLQYLYLTFFIPVPDHLQKNILSTLLSSLFRGLGSLKSLAFVVSSAHKNVVAYDPSNEIIFYDLDHFAPPLLERFEWLLHSCCFSRVPKWIGKLGNLCILKISVKELMRDGVNILGELPALTTLSLYVKIEPVQRIIFDKAGFSVLKYFKFKCSTVPWLKFETDAMPNLQKLKLDFSAHSHRQQNTVPISIEHLPGLKEISAKVRDVNSDAESSLTAAVSNHPRNPRIRMQLVDWNSYGHRNWYMISKQENPDTENVMLGPDSDIASSCISFLSGTTLDEMDQKGTVPISIEHLPGPKEISTKVGDASSDAEFALTAAVSNHQRNPRIRMQLVDWNPGTENVMHGPDSDIASSCISFLSGTTLDEMDQKGTVPISIEHLPGPKEISAKVGDASSDEEFSFLPGVALHENNWRELLGIQTGDLRQLIIACGKAVDENAYYADILMSELREMVSVSGEPMQRLGAYMLEGLIARLSSTGYALYKSLKCKEPLATNTELISWMHVLYEICPFFKFGYMSANGAINDAVTGEDIIHIIDFQIAQGSQWITMIQALASRPGRRPLLRITGIDDSNSAHARGGGLDMCGQRLHRIAQSCGLPFEFNAVPAASHEFVFEDLCLRPGEAVVVNFAYQLHHTPDESVGIENHRDRILRTVKSLSPKVVTLVEQEANTNTAPFFPRYMETLDYYTAVFEAIDASCPRDDKNRISTEQYCVARDIVNLIACEGAERIERHEPFGKWRARLAMAGFRPEPLSPLVNSTIKTLLDSYHSYYSLEERDGILLLGWKNRKLVVSSAWC